MSYPINYPTPQNANVQIFYRGDNNTADWVKPQGASFVWFTLIGAGSGGDGTWGGNSGNVLNFMCPAFLIPDVLTISVGKGSTSTGTSTKVLYSGPSSVGYTLLESYGGNTSGNNNTANAANFFTAMGFYQSTTGEVGISSGSVAASSTTFLSVGGPSGGLTSNYGYTTGASGNRNGFFQMQPIIVGAGGNGTGRGGIGCGGGNSGTTGRGGDGLAVIITW
jgi:hypothetical protein